MDRVSYRRAIERTYDLAGADSTGKSGQGAPDGKIYMEELDGDSLFFSGQSSARKKDINYESLIARDTVKDNFAVNEYMSVYAVLSYLDTLDNQDELSDSYIELSSFKAYTESLFDGVSTIYSETSRFNKYLELVIKTAEFVIQKNGETEFYTRSAVAELKRLLGK